MTWEVRNGDALALLRDLEPDSVQCAITSPPYYGLRDYGTDQQIGLEPTPDEYVARLVEVFAEVRRVLRPDGTLWLNMGDSYAGSWGAQSRPPGDASTLARNGGTGPNPKMLSAAQIAAAPRGQTHTGSIPADAGYKPKDLLGIPWLLAFALRADGWYLRSDIIWAKPNPMPESVTDRPTSAHEHVFLLAKSARYFYDAAAIREPWVGEAGDGKFVRKRNSGGRADGYTVASGTVGDHASGRNKRNVWEIATQPYPEAHFATFPAKLVEPCILAGTSPKACGGSDWEPTRCVVLDPFAGSGTVGVACGWHGRDFLGLELNSDYCELARRRILVEGRPSRRPVENIDPIPGQLALL